MASSCPDFDSDLAMALELQWRMDAEEAAAQANANAEVAELLPPEWRTPGKVARSSSSGDSSSSSTQPSASLVAPEWEDIDPTPDLHALFRQFDGRFFWGRLQACEVRWSPRMTLCAGVCSYQRRSGYCSIRLSVPLLKLRPRSDLVETLLHEMIHAYLFVTDGDDDHDGHGPAFHSHMNRINKEAGTKISVYHNFHDEVAAYQTHWWKCDGPCQRRPPYFGLVKRAMNRAPGKNDRWFSEHQANCGGTFVKIKEPEGYGKKKPSKRKLQMEEKGKGQKDIRSFVGGGAKGKENKGEAAGSSSATSAAGSSGSGGGGGARGNIFGFGGTSFSGPASAGGGVKTKGKAGAMVVNPGWKTPADNSSGGEAIGNVSGSSRTSSTSSSMTTGGQRLGGGDIYSLTSASSRSARQDVRDFWSNRFPSATSTSTSSQPSSSKKGQAAKAKKNFSQGTSSANTEQPVHLTSLASCPVCSKEVPESSINHHLDECLTRSALDEEKGTKEVEKSRKCPRCRRQVYEGEMGFHSSVCSGTK